MRAVASSLGKLDNQEQRSSQGLGVSGIKFLILGNSSNLLIPHIVGCLSISVNGARDSLS